MNTWTHLKARLERNGERGAGLVEYLFVVSLIAIVCMVSVTYFGGRNDASMMKSANTITSAGGPVCPAPGHINPNNGLCEM